MGEGILYKEPVRLIIAIINWSGGAKMIKEHGSKLLKLFAAVQVTEANQTISISNIALGENEKLT